MYQSLLGDEKLLEFLLHCDCDLAEEARGGGCGRCGGRLHRANYPRKPRGGRATLDPEQALRLSFCCAAEGCRRRLTPPSLRFLGRKVYLAAVVVLVAALRHGVTRARTTQLHELVGVSRRTLIRWRQWWRTTFAHSRFWQAARGRFRTPIAAAALPHRLLDCFPGDPRARLLALLRFLAPITTASADRGSTF